MIVNMYYLNSYLNFIIYVRYKKDKSKGKRKQVFINQKYVDKVTNFIDEKEFEDINHYMIPTGHVCNDQIS